MMFITLLCLQFLLMLANVFGNESSESEEIHVVGMKDMMCEEKHAKISKIIVECFDEMSLSENSFVTIQCYAGLNGKIKGEAMRDWYCSHTEDEVKNADECSDKTAITEKGEEFFNKTADLFGECMKSKLPGDRRK